MGKKVAQVTKKVANFTANAATGGVYGAVKNVANGESAISSYASYLGVNEATRVVAKATGATAAQEGLKQQLDQSQREARRQALISDALAREEGGEAAKISLNTGKNRKNSGSSATGISGASSSSGTGVQS